MENIGKYDDYVKEARLVISKNNYTVEDGIRALRDIHNATNKIASNGNYMLSEVLGRPETWRTYVLAAFVELAEFIQVLPWKPWRDSVKEIDSDKLLDEFADVLAFIGVLITILGELGYTPDDIASAYISKEFVNVSRFEDKYKESINGTKI